MSYNDYINEQANGPYVKPESAASVTKTSSYGTSQADVFIPARTSADGKVPYTTAKQKTIVRTYRLKRV